MQRGSVEMWKCVGEGGKGGAFGGTKGLGTSGGGRELEQYQYVYLIGAGYSYILKGPARYSTWTGDTDGTGLERYSRDTRTGVVALNKCSRRQRSILLVLPPSIVRQLTSRNSRIASP